MNDELAAIFDRIANGQFTEADVVSLRQFLESGDREVKAQFAKFNVNIGNGKDIHIGDCTYYGTDAEAIRTILREVISQTLEAKENSELIVNWQKVSQELLHEYQRLTTNILTVGEGLVHSIDKVYVPLGLVERKRKARRLQDVLPERGSELYQETEITKKFEHDEFLEQVLKYGKSFKSEGKRLAIIGEPGSGKTTLLQRIAKWLSQEIDGAIVIWVSLADLQGEAIETYLLDRWLASVARRSGEVEASKNLKNDFIVRLNQDQVWLLLDGADEMSILSSNPLSEIARQVRTGSLLSQMRIILTCRLNMWDNNRNALETFDTYRTLEFSYPEQVEQFIKRWFTSLNTEEENRSQQLCDALKQRGKERIQDLVKNPLRLTLLCFNWYLSKGRLPETKAEFYRQFVEDFYQWKDEQFTSSLERRRELNNQFKILAREAIDRESTRYQLTHDFACRFLGEPDDKSSPFYLAIEIGWLNKIGIDTANPKKFFYALFHTTFQEYFAALSIDNWQFFLNHIPKNPNHPDASYRVFEPQWREVILLWFGRKDITKEAKISFIKALIYFEDVSSNFYCLQAFLLAAICLNEFTDCSHNISEEIFKQIIKWGFGYFNHETQEYVKFIKSITQSARLTLEQTLPNFSSDYLVDLLHNSPYEFIRIQAAKILEKINPKNTDSITELVNLIHNSPDESIRVQASEALGAISSKYCDAITELVNLINSSSNESTRIQAVESLVRIKPEHPQIITTLIELIVDSKDSFIQLDSAKKLIDINQKKSLAIKTLIKLSRSNNQIIRSNAYNILQSNYPTNKRIKENVFSKIFSENSYISLLDFIKNSDDFITRIHSIFQIIKLMETYPINLEVVKEIVEIIKNNKEQSYFHKVQYVLLIKALESISDRESVYYILSHIQQNLANNVYEYSFELFEKTYELVFSLSKSIPYPKFYSVWKPSLVCLPHENPTRYVDFSDSEQILSPVDLGLDSYKSMDNSHQILVGERVIFLRGKVTDDMANAVIANMLYLDFENEDQAIYLHINSQGGSISAGMAIYDTIQHIKSDVITVCIGLAVGISALILASGAKGKRMCLHTARIALRNANSPLGISEKLTEIEVAKNILPIIDMTSRIDRLFIQNTNGMAKEILNQTKTQGISFMSASDALKYGFIDDIFTSLNVEK